MSEKIVLAFSGGLDTSYCVMALREQGFELLVERRGSAWKFCRLAEGGAHLGLVLLQDHVAGELGLRGVAEFHNNDLEIKRWKPFLAGEKGRILYL